jgi:ABC-type transport system involved in multi-copper enzyme maturation permease subunit
VWQGLSSSGRAEANSVSPFSEVELITLRELRRTFRSAKGGILAGLSVAGGAGVSMLVAWLDRLQSEKVPAEIQGAARDQFFQGLYGADSGHAIAASPYPLWMMLEGALWLAPLLVALMNFDAVSGELSHRSVRFWTVRVRRSSYILGKYLAGWLSVLAVLLTMNVIVWGVTIVVGHFSAGDVFTWGPRYFLVLLPVTAAWCGIATLVGAQFKTPMLSLLAIFAAFFGLWFLRVVAGFSNHDAFAYVYPNFYDAFLLSTNGSQLATGLGATLGIALLAAAAGTLLFERRDI